MAPPAVLLLLLSVGLLCSCGSPPPPPPRTSFLLNSAERPLLRFSVHNTTTLLPSDDGSTLYVGAQNALLSLDVSRSDVITLKKKVEWSPTRSEINDCENKGKNPTVDCPNFVHVLQKINSTHLYACGSYAYSPHDAFIDTESFSLVQQVGNKFRCPFSPFQRNIAHTVDGELFTATTTDFRGVKPQISRHFSRDGRPDVSLDLSVRSLEEPAFVSSSLDAADRKLYFFFSEVGKEFSFVDELWISRVAQVCKDDVGGQRTLQKKWTSFAKAALLCQSPKQLPFNVLQDMFTLPPAEGADASTTLFYGVFTSQWSLAPESAVCVFSLQDVRRVFTQSYRTFDMSTGQWRQTSETQSYLGQCDLDGAPDAQLANVKMSFLTGDSVRTAGVGPLFVSSEQRYSRVAAMRTPDADGRQRTVLFLLTESGFLHKVVLLDQGARVIEEVQVFTQPQLIKSMVLSSTKEVVFVGTSEGVLAVPVANCSVYRTCSRCVLAGDPLCGWSRGGGVCTRLDGSHQDVAQDLDNVNVEEKCQGQTRTSPDTADDKQPDSRDESNEDTAAEEPATSTAPPPGEPEDSMSKDDSGVFSVKDETDSVDEVPGTQNDFQDDGPQFTPTSRTDAQLGKELLDVRKEKSYYSELVVVSVLLAACVCVLILAALHVWRQKKVGLRASPLVGPEDGSKTTTSMESVPSLSRAEEAEVKVEE